MKTITVKFQIEYFSTYLGAWQTEGWPSCSTYDEAYSWLRTYTNFDNFRIVKITTTTTEDREVLFPQVEEGAS